MAKTNTTPVTSEQPINPLDDRVTVNIAPPTEADEGKVLFVSVNGYTANIAYGEDVQVPRFVLYALELRKMALADKRKNEKKRSK